MQRIKSKPFDIHPGIQEHLKGTGGGLTEANKRAFSPLNNTAARDTHCWTTTPELRHTGLLLYQLKTELCGAHTLSCVQEIHMQRSWAQSFVGCFLSKALVGPAIATITKIIIIIARTAWSLPMSLALWLF